MERMIEYKGWVDERGEEYGIWNDGVERVYLYWDKEDKVIGDIKDM